MDDRHKHDFEEFKKELFDLLDKHGVKIEFNSGLYGVISEFEISGRFGKIKTKSRDKITNIRKFIKKAKK